MSSPEQDQVPMNSALLDRWLSEKAKDKFGALYPHTALLRPLLLCESSPSDTATKFLEAVASKPIRGDHVWRLLELVFNCAAEMTSSHPAILALCQAFLQLPQTPEGPNRISSGLLTDWWVKLDMFQSHAILSGQTSWADNYINFQAFSARFLQLEHDNRNVKQVLGIRAFCDIRDALEFDKTTKPETWLWATGAEVESWAVLSAAQWLIFAGQVIHTFENGFFGEQWERGLAAETDHWQGKPGFSKERWEFWASMFAVQASREELSRDARETGMEASRIIRWLQGKEDVS